ncbi:Mrp/NBP35 family ATP-binding protein [Alkalicaulis satelles]|uniref:Iron-sulfur cluster carrier protein n=1 Tax=Alkalicaulis satelles TaxID=2609175 RepID=A0A5M6ZL83_9PROT|nr:Mrp/NBP35 family ATP-binding protein [Alkalicaulis satelles]KAA5805090.1 Mrp/NBP35 family ATP-binding protein [Alkalicaulis satelles]
MTDLLMSALAPLKLPSDGRALGESGRIAGCDLRDGVATIVLKPGPEGEDLDALRAAVAQALEGVAGVTRTRVIVEAALTAPARSRQAQGQPAKPVRAPARRIIAVASGKGGVGKSTVAANLAGACVKLGLKTGLMDADIYGPSAPRIFGLSDAPGLRKGDDGIEPLEAHGVKLVSMGFLVGERDPVVWRGPMVTGAIRQFLTEVNWGDLDVLIIDMPPGTGDAQLAVAQGAPISGVVIVSTPQTLALDDARKAAALFDRTEIPILGLIENMSFFLCPHCGEGTEIFGRGGARAEAELIGAPFLGEIPLHPELREASDEGRLVASGDGPVAKAFVRAAEAMLTHVEAAWRPAPEIVFTD